MYKEAIVQTRIESKIKAEAEAIFNKVGISPPEAVRLFYKQVCLHKGLPFEVKIPNEKTLKALHEIHAGEVAEFKNLDDFLKDLNN